MITVVESVQRQPLTKSEAAKVARALLRRLGSLEAVARVTGRTRVELRRLVTGGSIAER